MLGYFVCEPTLCLPPPPQAQVCLASVYAQEPVRDGSKSVQYLKMAAESGVSALLDASGALSMASSLRFPPLPEYLLSHFSLGNRISPPSSAFWYSQLFCKTSLLTCFFRLSVTYSHFKSLKSYSPSVESHRAILTVLIVTSSVICSYYYVCVSPWCRLVMCNIKLQMPPSQVLAHVEDCSWRWQRQKKSPVHFCSFVCRTTAPCCSLVSASRAALGCSRIWAQRLNTTNELLERATSRLRAYWRLLIAQTVRVSTHALFTFVLVIIFFCICQRWHCMW